MIAEVFRLAVVRAKIDLRSALRSKEALVGTFAVPILLLVLFTTILGGEIDNTGVDFSSYFVAGIIGSVTVSLGYQDLAVTIAHEEYNGTLKRLAATPMPKAAYFLGKVIYLVVAAAAQIALMLAMGVAFTDLSLPPTIGQWFTFAWVFVLGLTASGLAGICVTRLIKNPSSATAVTLPAYLVLSFISGVYFVQTSLPGWLQTVANVFPLRWVTLGLRSAFLPDNFASQETGGSWQHGTIALVLGAWIVGLSLVAAKTFTWTERAK